jgi:hypothetical protein
MKLYVIALQGLEDNSATSRSLNAEVEKAMKTRGSVNSNTGRTAALAINWCERHGIDYEVRCIDGFYYVAHARRVKQT